MTGPPKPVLLYDGKCGFCRIWIDYWRQITGDTIVYAASQDAASSYPQITPEQFEKSVHLVLPSGEVHSGAWAVYETLAADRSRAWLLAAYQRFAAFAAASEAAYRFVASHRPFFARLTMLLFGGKIDPLRYDVVQWLFLRLLGIMYTIAFGSFGLQSAGLIGSDGIQPAGLYLPRISEALGSSAFLLAPTVFWLRSDNLMVRAVCIAGIVCAVLVISGVLWRAALLGAFLLYLSLVNVSQEFLSYQWDYLLLEAGFLAIFAGYSSGVVWLFRWLLFRLMFFSGVVKLASGDPTWRNLTALTFHYQTQPLPTPLAWYAQLLPTWLQRASCIGVFLFELLIPWLVLGPRRTRYFALPWLVGLQLLILLTGNYAFFNWLAISLCLFLIDDQLLRRMLPRIALERIAGVKRVIVPVRVRRAVVRVLIGTIGLLTGLITVQTLLSYELPGASTILAWAAPWGIANSYGLFANMTTTRAEIIVEGSNDGTEWRSYELKYKPGPLTRKPPWVAPYQPRLDWQMWFAALESYRENVWFLNFVARLLQGRPEVLALMEFNPFRGQPPRYIRAEVFEYRFTDSQTRQRTGEWWTRSRLGVYLPPVSLASLSGLRVLQQH